MATVGAIVGGVGVVTGVAILVAARPGQAKGEKPRASGATLNAAVGPGRFELGGTF